MYVNLYQTTQSHPRKQYSSSEISPDPKCLSIASFVTMQYSAIACSVLKQKTELAVTYNGEGTLVIHETACDLYKLNVLTAVMFPHPHSF
jgi:hypothetical protein